MVCRISRLGGAEVTHDVYMYACICEKIRVCMCACVCEFVMAVAVLEGGKEEWGRQERLIKSMYEHTYDV